ncbi:MAG: ATPase [Gammaproteobacteria bacterium]|nr:ATPase [Gammaproteobacteria bacterium]
MTGTGYNRRPPGTMRGDHLLEELVHDPYHSKSKLRAPAVCGECHAVFVRGRWQWGEVPDGAEATTCPACARIRDKVAAGFVSLGGEFFREHHDEIMHLVDHRVAHENAEHPLKRLMGTETLGDRLVLSFTDPHLAAGVGHALHAAYKGDLAIDYQKGEYMVRVTWER